MFLMSGVEVNFWTILIALLITIHIKEKIG